MLKKGIFARLEAKPDKVDQVETFLKEAQPVVEDEPDTVVWFAIKLGPTTFGIFDAFPDEQGQQAHLNGDVAAALMERAPELFATDPQIEKADILATKMP